MAADFRVAAASSPQRWIPYAAAGQNVISAAADWVMAIVKIYYGRGYDIRADVVVNTKRPAGEDILHRLNLQL